MMPSKEARPALTLLYVPADRPDRMRKAFASAADVVVLDLEDAVASTQKDTARATIREILMPLSVPECAVQVRINARGTTWHEDDLEAVIDLPPYVEIRVPKVESVEHVDEVRDEVHGRDIHAIIESALGVERAFDIAACGVRSVALGEADLRSDLGLPSGIIGDAGLIWMRSRIINAAAAAKIQPPMMSVYTNIKDADGLVETSVKGRHLGFVGRAAIHPRQLAPIREAFSPSGAEVQHAKRILEKLTHALDSGSGVLALEDGTFVDRAMVRAAERTIALAPQSEDLNDTRRSNTEG